MRKDKRDKIKKNDFSNSNKHNNLNNGKGKIEREKISYLPSEMVVFLDELSGSMNNDNIDSKKTRPS
jgi:hypothetical protein